MAVFFLHHAAQIAVTPVGEGMDFFGHWGYVVFFAEEGRAPKPGELSLPQRLIEILNSGPSPDNTSGRRYSAWSQLDLARREQLKSILFAPITSPQYTMPNSQSQHPPLYYWLLSAVYPSVKHLGLDRQVYLSALASLFLASLALPAIYLTFRLYFDTHLSTLALLCVAWFPNLMPFLGRVTNDTLAFALIAWCMYFCVRSRCKTYEVMVAGGLLTLSAYTKSYALVLVPVYILSAGIELSEQGRVSVNRKNMAVALTCASVGLGSLFVFNYLTAGHLVLLREIRDTSHVPVLDKIQSVLGLNPVWFLGGLVKGFWWSGYWSFVSPGIVYYLPLLSLPYVVLRRPRGGYNGGQFLSIRALWPHYLAIALFVLGMAWHATLFKIRAEVLGEAVHSGNEGWYLNVILGSFFAIGIVLLSERLTYGKLRRLLAVTAFFCILWSLYARIVLAAFWSGQVEVEGPLRGANWGDLMSALSGYSAWHNWLSLPGVIQPIMFTSGLPLIAALLLSFYVIKSLRAAV